MLVIINVIVWTISIVMMIMSLHGVQNELFDSVFTNVRIFAIVLSMITLGLII